MIWSKPYSRDKLALPDELIHTQRLILRPVCEDDFESLWQMDSDPEVMQYIRPVATDKKEFMAEMSKDLAEGKRFKFFRIMTDKVTNHVIGWLLFRPTEDGQWVELGYRVLKQYWGKGYAPEASKALINLGFERLGLDQVMAVLMNENENSANVAKKLGMEYKGQKNMYDLDLAFYLVEKPYGG